MRNRLVMLAVCAACGLLLSPAAIAGTVSAGNGVYTITVTDNSEDLCGAWTATTASAHPAGPGHNVLYGGGSPGTSYTSFKAYDWNTSWSTGGSDCEYPICYEASEATSDLLYRDGFTVGVRSGWRMVRGERSVWLIQEVVVEGPVDGTETVNNTMIRETHTVRNETGEEFIFGLRKMWDWEIANDDGPWLGDCERPTAACDRSMNLTPDGSLSGPYPAAYTINEEPAEAACPGSIEPSNPAGCSGFPIYLVAGTVSGPETLEPPPTPPELFQFNNWSALFGECWLPSLFDSATCGGGDTAAAYFYGLTEDTAERLEDGEQRSFTQYVVAGEDACPDIIEPSAGMVFSTPTIEFVVFTGPIVQLESKNAYTVTFDVPSLEQFNPTFLPLMHNLDAIDVLDGSSMLFSVHPNRMVAHTGGVINLMQGQVYRLDMSDGTITLDEDWAALGLTPSTLNAIDRLADGSYVFSTDALTFVWHQGQMLPLRPSHLYLVEPDGSVQTLLDGLSFGLTSIDAVDLLPDNRIAFSPGRQAFLYGFGPIIPVFDQDVWIFDPLDGSLVKHDELDAVGLRGLDALTMQVGEAGGGDVSPVDGSGLFLIARPLSLVDWSEQR